MADRFPTKFPDLPRLPKARTRPRPPTPRRKAAFPTGPAWASRLRRPARVDGFGPPPPGFTIGTTSDSEWVLYAALAAITGYPKDARQPPFQGGPPRWFYQSNFGGGRQLGGAVPDFLVDQLGELFIFRLQSHHFHIATGRAQQSHDLLQKLRLARVGGKPTRVVDIAEQDFLRKDPGQTAAAAVRVLKAALAGQEFANPIASGTAARRVPPW